MLFPQQNLQVISAKSVTNSLIDGKIAALAAQGANCRHVPDSQKFTEVNIRGENRQEKGPQLTEETNCGNTELTGQMAVLPLVPPVSCRLPGSSPHFADTWPCRVWAGNRHSL